MIPTRQRPTSTRTLSSAFVDQVPEVIEAYLRVMLDRAEAASDEFTVDQITQRIKDNLIVRHLPDRRAFEAAFLSKQACPAEVKFDGATDRIYLVGVGLPGREELVVSKRPVYDEKTGRKIMDEVVTESVHADDTVLSYTEISWPEYRNGVERTEKLDGWVREGLLKYFQLPPSHLLGVVLATYSHTDEDLYRIAQYALDPIHG